MGTVLSVTLGQNGWFGEGDDFFYIDGEPVPSLQGTGSEDYFNDAWGFRTRTGPWFGQPRWQGDTAGDSGVCYRWHLLDPVHFSQSLKVAIEHKGNRDEDIDGFFLERPDFFSSVAYWYQTGQPKTTFAPLPPWHERRIPWQQHHLVKAYRYARVSGKAQVQVQTQGFFGARPVLTWPNTEPGALLTLPFDLPEDGRYAVRLTAATGPRHGTYQIEIDGEKILSADFRASEDNEMDLPLGTQELKKGNHTIAFRAVRQCPPSRVTGASRSCGCSSCRPKLYVPSARITRPTSSAWASAGPSMPTGWHSTRSPNRWRHSWRRASCPSATCGTRTICR